MVVFPFPANWRTPINERLEWLTDVLEHRDATEQRIQLRQNARQTIEFEFAAFREYLPLLQSLLYGSQGKPWIAPLWFHTQTLAVTLPANSTVIPCNTIGYQYQIGAYLLIYASPTKCETLKITQITESNLVVELPTSIEWQQGTLILPAYKSRLTDPITVTFASEEIAFGTVRFTIEHFLQPTSTFLPSDVITKNLVDYPLFSIAPNKIKDTQEAWARAIEHIDNGIGNSLVLDLLSHTRNTTTYSFSLFGREAINKYRNLLFYLSGRLKSVWFPTYNKDLYLAQDIVEGVSITIKSCSYSSQVFPASIRRRLKIQYLDGRVFYRTIMDAVENIALASELLTLDLSLPSANKEEVTLSFNCFRRMDSDVAELVWTSPLILDTQASFKEVNDVLWVNQSITFKVNETGNDLIDIHATGNREQFNLIKVSETGIDSCSWHGIVYQHPLWDSSTMSPNMTVLNSGATTVRQGSTYNGYSVVNSVQAYSLGKVETVKVVFSGLVTDSNTSDAYFGLGIGGLPIRYRPGGYYPNGFAIGLYTGWLIVNGYVIGQVWDPGKPFFTDGTIDLTMAIDRTNGNGSVVLTSTQSYSTHTVTLDSPDTFYIYLEQHDYGAQVTATFQTV